MRPLPLTLWALIAAQIDALSPGQQPNPDPRQASEPQPQSSLLPTAVRKMPPDQGAKFHHSYCAFPQDGQEQEQHPLNFKPAAAPPPELGVFSNVERIRRREGNASMPLLESFNAPFAVTHLDYGEQSVLRRAAEVLYRLQKRQWACPSGTSGCGAIGYPNSCCRDGETCVVVQDTGLGPVGCCPAGSTCSGGVSGCTDGSTACASDIGGGCCIPGFVCQGVGCVSSVSTTTTTAVTTAPAPGPTGVTTFTTTSTSVIQAPTPSTVVVTVIVTISPSQVGPTTSTVTSTQTAQPPPLGPTSSQQQGSTADPGAPYRPTSSRTNGISTYCPTGFYACLASAGGGCCQTGRDCQTTSCPPVAMTTIVNAGGVTVVVPAEGAAATTGSCASGWYLCGSDAGPQAGCCPSGYGCGTASCSLAVDGATATVAKVRPGSDASMLSLNLGWIFTIVGICLFVF